MCRKKAHGGCGCGAWKKMYGGGGEARKGRETKACPCGKSEAAAGVSDDAGAGAARFQPQDRKATAGEKTDAGAEEGLVSVGARSARGCSSARGRQLAGMSGRIGRAGCAGKIARRLRLRSLEENVRRRRGARRRGGRRRPVRAGNSKAAAGVSDDAGAGTARFQPQDRKATAGKKADAGAEEGLFPWGAGRTGVFLRGGDRWRGCPGGPLLAIGE